MVQGEKLSNRDSTGGVSNWDCVGFFPRLSFFPVLFPPIPMEKFNPAARIADKGFIAALDQSGGSTPKALEAYGINPNRFTDAAGKIDEEKMFELVHAMRTRIITNEAFDHRISGAILFEKTMEGTIDGMPTAQYLSEVKGIAPFLKIDEGLAAESDGVQLMKDMKGLDPRLQKAVENGIYGTKMRSVINAGHAGGIETIVSQQFAVAERIIRAGLMPIVEPEVNIKAQDKAIAEVHLRRHLKTALDNLSPDKQVMLKLTLPEEADFYEELIHHPRVLRVVALSGGYSRELANQKLAQNHGMTASFSRALVEDIRDDQTDAEFTAALDAAIQSIYEASIT